MHQAPRILANKTEYQVADGLSNERLHGEVHIKMSKQHVVQAHEHAGSA